MTHAVRLNMNIVETKYDSRLYLCLFVRMKLLKGALLHHLLRLQIRPLHQRRRLLRHRQQLQLQPPVSSMHIKYFSCLLSFPLS